MTLESFKKIFYIESSSVEEIKYVNNDLLLTIRNENYQYAMGNGFRDEENISCIVKYRFEGITSINGSFDLTYIDKTVVEEDTINLIGNTTLSFKCQNIIISGDNDEDI